MVLYWGEKLRWGDDKVWVYNVEEDAWTDMSPESTPGKMTFHAMTYVDELGSVVLFGGMLDESYDSPLEEPWLYDYEDNNWYPLSESR